MVFCFPSGNPFLAKPLYPAPHTHLGRLMRGWTCRRLGSCSRCFPRGSHGQHLPQLCFTMLCLSLNQCWASQTAAVLRNRPQTGTWGRHTTEQDCSWSPWICSVSLSNDLVEHAALLTIQQASLLPNSWLTAELLSLEPRTLCGRKIPMETPEELRLGKPH